jgi:NTE family protein
LLDFNGIEDPNQREFLNQIPTSFSLTDEQVDALIAAGGELLRGNPEFRRLLADLAADARSGH